MLPHKSLLQQLKADVSASLGFVQVVVAEHDVVLATLGPEEPWTLANYESLDGYQAQLRQAQMHACVYRKKVQA